MFVRGSCCHLDGNVGKVKAPELHGPCTAGSRIAASMPKCPSSSVTIGDRGLGVKTGHFLPAPTVCVVGNAHPTTRPTGLHSMASSSPGRGRHMGRFQHTPTACHRSWTGKCRPDWVVVRKGACEPVGPGANLPWPQETRHAMPSPTWRYELPPPPPLHEYPPVYFPEGVGEPPL